MNSVLIFVMPQNQIDYWTNQQLSRSCESRPLKETKPYIEPKDSSTRQEITLYGITKCGFAKS